MASIKIGDKYIPVYRHVDFTGEPGPNPVINITDLIASDMFYNYSVLVGDGSSPTNYDHPEAVGSTTARISGGRTPLHGAEIVFSENVRPAPDNAGPWRDGVIDITMVEGQQTILLQSSTITLVEQKAPRYYGVIEQRHAYAISFAYPEAAAEKDRVKGFYIYTVRNLREFQPSGTIYANTFTLDTVAIGKINIPYYNKTNNLSLYYDDEPEPSEDDPNEQDPDYPSSPGEPEPDHNIIIDQIPIPSLPSMGSATAGFLTMYKLSLSTIQQFASDMFASSIWEAIKLFFTNPMDFLVGCMLLPFEPTTGSSYYPKFGIFTFEHSYPAVSNQYKEIDCGYVDVKKFWGSAFDYEPFTKLQIWLPYIGYRDIPTDEFMGEQLHVVYHCDCLTGDCVAFITTTSSVPGQYGPNVARVLAQYYGNCGVRVPFSSVNFDAAVAAGINLIGAAASMGLSKGSGSVAMGGSRGGFHGSDADNNTSSGVVGMAIDEGYSEPSGSGLAGATINMVESMKPTVQKGGAAGASNGYMSIQKPYLIKRIPRQSLPENYVKIKGYPSNIGGTLSNFSGYAEVENIQLNNIPAMETERKEILSWLSGGVII